MQQTKTKRSVNGIFSEDNRTYEVCYFRNDERKTKAGIHYTTNLEKTVGVVRTYAKTR